MGSQKQLKDVRPCSVCINSSPSVSVDVSVDERVPLIGPRRSEASLNWFLLISLLLFFLAGIGIATYLLFTEESEDIPESYKIVDRQKWNSRINEALLFPILKPLSKVHFRSTYNLNCSNNGELSAHVEESCFEFNFIFESAGGVSEILGWNYTFSTDEFLFGVVVNRLDLALSTQQLKNIKVMLKLATEMKLLQDCYEIVFSQENANIMAINQVINDFQANLNDCITYSFV